MENQQHQPSKFHKELVVSASKSHQEQNQEASAAMASASNNTNLCCHLSLGVCPCVSDDDSPSKKNNVFLCAQETGSSSQGVSLWSHASCSSSSSPTKKRKHGTNSNDHVGARKRACNNDAEATRWGFSTELMLYDDPWKIKKVLQKSDIGNMSRLLLPKNLSENLVLPVLDDDARRYAETEIGTRVRIWDVDTNSMHSLVFKRWDASSKSYVFIDKWAKDFVKRRGLKTGDEIGLHWDPYKTHFDFTVFHPVKLGKHQS